VFPLKDLLAEWSWPRERFSWCCGLLAAVRRTAPSVILSNFAGLPRPMIATVYEPSTA